jgi:hypothetical protein
MVRVGVRTYLQLTFLSGLPGCGHIRVVKGIIGERGFSQGGVGRDFGAFFVVLVVWTSFLIMKHLPS